MKRFNDHLALLITSVVSTMWCAYVFGFLALISLPTAIRGGTGPLVSWVAQTFLQLVLLSIIMVGQRVMGESHAELHGKVDALHDKHDALHQHLGVGR